MNDYDTPEIRCSLRNLSRVTECRAGTSTDRNNNTSLERQIYSFPGKTKSKVWDYFGFYKVKDGPASKHTLDMSQAICRKCGKKYANKGRFKIQSLCHSFCFYVLKIIKI